MNSEQVSDGSSFNRALSGFAARMLRPVARLSLRFMRLDDPWKRIPCTLPVTAFGAGSTRPFTWYFEGEPGVEVASVDEVAAWLTGCSYASDPELFSRADLWQHPRVFETLRRGDCEDHALWAWRKLVELGTEAEFFCGRWRQCPEQPADLHAWVVYREAGRPVVLETVAPTRREMIRPLDEVRHLYTPHFAVDRHFRQYAFRGYLAYLREGNRAGIG